MNSYLAIFLPAAALPAWGGTATITIDPAKPGPRISPDMYGIFLEEINYGVDGGLYPELVANRAFEDSRPPEGFTLRGGRYKDRRDTIQVSRSAITKCRAGPFFARTEPKAPCIWKPPAD